MIDRDLNYGRHIIKSYLSSEGVGPKTVLDLGAGQGADLLIARHANPEATLHAVECYGPYIESLKSKNIEVHSLNIECDSLPFEDQSIDIVIANQILEHTKEIFWIFHEVTRVLKPGGKFIVGVPNLASFHNRLMLLFGSQPTSLKNNSAHVRGYTLPDLKRFVHSCFPNGYKISKFAGSNFYPFPPMLARPLASLLPSMAWAIFLMLEKKNTYTNEFLNYPITERLETNFYLGK
ncbi:class I SAM-dependent methyltransferase [Pontibacter sp. FD36]|uniref:class I SAM-dependent methyltransferase n=1 Tax=Pontibacter sp. FD36 TaxID=2789860 RepID=UPI0018ABF0A8|nr:class I SAM-dependent methyltransferase [Pontibacter sp. FD36]MBF8964586.1 class I SAM-dependent methyltransferase [Pontibacter sp. FD36]